MGFGRRRGSRAGVPIQGRTALATRARDDRATSVRPAILVNLAVDGSRGRARRRSELDGTAAVVDEPARDLLAGLETRAELLDALALLTPRQRAVLVLRYFNDLTEAQTAEVLGCSPGTVKSSASRGLARLREALAAVPNPTPNPTREL
jgi:RNA polymerase sigma factor (sigma-70 family)